MSDLGYGFYPTHPGEVVKDELEERGISQRKFADSLEMGYSVLNEILNARRPITTTTALMFEAALDIPADSLLKMQMKYNMHTAMEDNSLHEKLKNIPDIREDSLIISADKDSMANYMEEAYERNSRTLFNECVANLSRDAAFMLVADMNKISRIPERFEPYLPAFLLENAPLFHSFILSTQLSVVNDRLSHIMVLTYKD